MSDKLNGVAECWISQPVVFPFSFLFVAGATYAKVTDNWIGAIETILATPYVGIIYS